MEHQKYKESIEKILIMPGDAKDIKFGLKNALFGVGCSLKSENYTECVRITKEILADNQICCEDIEDYIESLQYGYMLSNQ